MIEFSDIIYTVITGAAGSGLWASSVHAANYRQKKQPLSKLYKPNYDKPTWIVLSAVGNTDNSEYYKYLTPIDGVLSYSFILKYFSLMGFQKTIDARFPREINNDANKDNLILIGGYENNEASAAHNKSNGRHFFLENNEIRDISSLISLKADVNEKNNVIKDYCLVTRMKNPAANNDSYSALVAFEGVRHYGTIGGVRDFNETIYSKLVKMGSDPFDASIIEVILEYNIHYMPSSFSISDGKIISYYADGQEIFNSIGVQ